MADENLNDAPEENANTNAAPSENAQQALDDLTVLSDVGNQSLGESRLNLVRNVDVSDAAMGAWPPFTRALVRATRCRKACRFRPA